MRSVTFVTGLADTKTPYIIPCIAPERVCWAVIGLELPDLTSDWLSRVTGGPQPTQLSPCGGPEPRHLSWRREGAVTRNMTQRGHGARQ